MQDNPASILAISVSLDGNHLESRVSSIPVVTGTFRIDEDDVAHALRSGGGALFLRDGVFIDP